MCMCCSALPPLTCSWKRLRTVWDEQAGLGMVSVCVCVLVGLVSIVPGDKAAAAIFHR